MIGGANLELRERLGRALSMAQAVARESNASQPVLQELQDMERQLDSPLVVMALGEAQAGKSTLLDALFGETFCQVEARSAESRIRVFKFGARDQNIEPSPRVLEVHRALRFLKHFHVVDTPGADAVVPERERALEPFLGRADVVLMVVSAASPWATAVWKFLERTRGPWLENLVLVVQRADLRAQVELEAVAHHMEHAAQAYLGRTFPILAVSAQKALDAKSDGHGSESLLSESRLPALEKHIDERIAAGKARKSLAIICASVSRILEELTGGTGKQFDAVEEDLRQIGGIDAWLSARRDQSLGKVEKLLTAVSQKLELFQIHADDLLGRQLGLGQAVSFVFHRSDWQTAFDAQLHEELDGSFPAGIAAAFRPVEEDLEGAPLELREAIRQRLPNARPDLAAAFAERRGERLLRLESALEAKLRSPDVPLQDPAGNLTQRMVEEANEVVRKLAESFGPAAVVRAGGFRAKFCRELERSRRETLAALKPRLKGAVETCHRDLSELLEPLRVLCAGQQQAQRGSIERAAAARSALQGLANDLGIRGN